MSACHTIREQMLDLVYGLLDETEAQAVHTHIEECPSCRESFTIAQVQQRRIARAAQPILDVPAFAPPTEDDIPASTDTIAAPAIAPASETPPRKRRRAWPIAALVALSLMLAVGGAIYYQRGYAQLENQLTSAQSDVKKYDREVTAARAKFDAEVKQAAADLKMKFVSVEVTGDTQYRPMISNSFNVQVHDLDGQPVKTPTVVQVIDKAKNIEVFNRELPAEREEIVSLPSGLSQWSNHAVVVFKAGNSRVQEKIDWQPASHMLHLLCNKAVYQPGEILFFRALALERFHLKPPAAPLTLKASLADVHGKVVLERTMQTTESGIAADSFALPAELGEGLYSLVVVGQGDAVAQPTTRVLEVVREPKPFVVRLDRSRVSAGEQVTGIINFNDNGKPLANQDVNVTATLESNGNIDRNTVQNNSYQTQILNNRIQNQAQQQPLPQRVQNTVKLQTDAKGEAKVNISIPADWSNRTNSIRFDLNAGKKRQEAVENIEVTPREWTVDFFPEGGDLVAGAPQRVYFRVHTLGGEPLQPEGTIALFSSKGKIFESNQGIGVFTLTADPKEDYQVEILPKKGMKRKMPAFASLPIQTDGLILNVADVVQGEGKSVDLVLHNMHGPRSLLVTATCRGQMVGYRKVDAKRGENRASVPTDGAGILRITVYDLERKKLPLAERLVFRLPAKTLDLAVQFDKDGYAPRDKAKLDIKSNVASCWSSVAVVDRRFCTDQKEPSLAEHFLVLGELTSGDDLDQAHLVIADTDEARASLDLFLSTIGWRRFVPDQPAGQTVANRRAVAAPVYFDRRNDTTELRQAYEAELRLAVDHARGELSKSVGAIVDESAAAAARLNQLRIEMARFQDLPRKTLFVVVFALFSILVILGCVNYVRAMITWFRRRESATLHFGKGFAYLTAALVLYLMRGQFGILFDDRPDPGPERMAWVSEMPDPAAVVAQLTPKLRPQAIAATGRLPLLPADDTVALWMQNGPSNLAPLAKKGSQPEEVQAQELAKHIESLAIGQNLLSSQRGNYLNDEAQKALINTQNAANPRYTEQYQSAFQDQQMFRNPTGNYGYEPKQQQAVNPKNVAPTQTQQADKKMAREYVHQPVAGFDMQDTLLWKPLLTIDKGQAQLDFHLSNTMTNYRVLVFGHTADGQLGYYSGTLEVKKAK